jgi:predicted ATPase
MTRPITFPLRTISIRNLWRQKTFSIALNDSSPATIIHSVNGAGKTTLLKLLSDLSSRNFFAMTRVYFDSLNLHYTFGSLAITRTDVDRAADETSDLGLGAFPRRQNARQRRGRAGNTDEPPRVQHAVELKFTYQPIHESTPYVENITVTDDDWAFRIQRAVGPIYSLGPDRFIDRRTKRQYSTRELIREFSDVPGVSDDPDANCPAWLSALLDRCPMRLIETHRLQRQPMSKDDESTFDRRADAPSATRTVELCAEDMRMRLTHHYSLFAEKSQELDQSFVVRVLEKSSSPAMRKTEDLSKLRDIYKRVATNQQQLVEAKIIGNAEMLPFPERELSEDECGVLFTYVTDMTKKLAVFDDIYPKTRQFLQTINQLFAGKQIELDVKGRGFLVRVVDTGDTVPLSSLSSGEQHLLVLHYDALFAPANEATLLMIDEPEISLHVDWQYQFIDLLEKACRLNRSHALIATHSPQIVNGRDFVVLGLKESEPVEEMDEESNYDA